MNKRYLKKKKRREKKKLRAKRRPSKKARIRLPEVDESILERMKPLNPPEVVMLGGQPKEKEVKAKVKIRAKGFNKNMFMKDGDEPQPIKAEVVPKTGFNKGSWTKDG